jgi:hypothetical protein
VIASYPDRLPRLRHALQVQAHESVFTPGGVGEVLELTVRLESEWCGLVWLGVLLSGKVRLGGMPWFVIIREASN